MTLSGEAMFYPSAWHCLVAMVAQAVGAQPALAANAVNAVLMGIVLPLSMFALLRRLLPRLCLCWYAARPASLPLNVSVGLFNVRPFVSEPHVVCAASCGGLCISYRLR
ncbi:MAG: DUF6541 family protein [Eggerthellaceae bacterium]